MISQEKIKEWANLYLEHIKKIGIENHAQEEEGYKFKSLEVLQNNFDINASNLALMLEKSIENNNLVVGNHYFPRVMLILFAKEYQRFF